MIRFSALLDGLVYATSRNTKLRLIGDYLRQTPDPERGWALAALTDGVARSRPVRRILAELMAPRVDPELYRLSRDYVGDTAETVALLWPDGDNSGEPPPRLTEVVAGVQRLDNVELAAALAQWLDRLDSSGRWALLKLLTGALRVGVSSRLAKTAVADFGNVPVAEVESLWHGLSPPYVDLFAWLEGRGPRPDVTASAVFRPLMLAHALEPAELEGLDLENFAAEWKWDGVRVQVVAIGDTVSLYSRTGDTINAAFPEVAAAFQGHSAVLDGELLILRDRIVAPFNDLQQRLNRKAVTRRLMQQHPPHIRLYDALEIDGEDLRSMAFHDRRQRLEAWFARTRPERTDLSPLVPFTDRSELVTIWSGTREAGIEGLMLKRRASPYLIGRPKGHWYKWKRAALTVDCVLMYAQRGSGKRSSFYSDYTFGVWRDAGDGAGSALVPVGKAYSGYTDAELLQLDRWIRGNTLERFGPVRSVTPALVLEVAFDSVHNSVRHKSGVALRFPRIHRIRWDKPAAEADRLETLTALIA